MKTLLFLLFLLQKQCIGYNMCVIGATSGLGRELVYQGALNKNMSVLALSGSTKHIPLPCRVDSLHGPKVMPPFNNKNVHRDVYWNNLSTYNYESVVFTTCSSPFKHDYSDTLMAKVLPNLPESCKKLILVSADGIDESVKQNSLVSSIDEWYLKDAYRAKMNQEKLLGLNIFKVKYPELKKKIYRPRILSNSELSIETTIRQNLASQILNDLT